MTYIWALKTDALQLKRTTQADFYYAGALERNFLTTLERTGQQKVAETAASVYTFVFAGVKCFLCQSLDVNKPC